MKKERNIFIFLKFLKYNSFLGKLFAICHTFLFVFLSHSFLYAQVGNGKNFSEIMISEGATIISDDPYFNDQIVDREIEVLNGDYRFDTNGITVIISGDDAILRNEHISHKDKQSKQEKKNKIQECDVKKTQEYQKIKNLNDYHLISIPFLPNNISISRYGSAKCLMVNPLNFKTSMKAINAGFFYSNSLIENLQQQKYPFKNKLLLFLKTKFFFTRPPPNEIGRYQPLYDIISPTGKRTF